MRAQKKERQRDNILRSAAVLFSQDGYLNTTMSDIAGKAGVAKGTLYGYFDSKEDLFFELFRWYNQQIFQGAGLQNLPRDTCAVNRIVGLTRAVMTSAIDFLDFYALSLEFWSATVSNQKRDLFKSEFMGVYDAFISLIHPMLKEGIDRKEFTPDADTKAIARGIIGIMDAIGLQYWLGQSFDPVDTSTTLVKYLLTGIQYRGET